MLDWLIRRYCTHGTTRRGNCFLSILLLIKYGGALVITQSEAHPLIPHMVWTPALPRMTVREFNPVRRRMGWQALWRWPWFKGRWEKAEIGGEVSEVTIDTGRKR